MKIIIPMTGYGSRFVSAGYTELKPFINVLGRPVIQWITEGIYPGHKDFLFICRGEHLRSIPDMEKRLMAIAPEAQIFSIEEWTKKGPVWDVLCAADVIGDDEPCIINYCDFYLNWDWEKFKEDVTDRGCEGCVPCYSGFHPHLLPVKNIYASCLTDQDEDLIEIREKYTFEKDKTKAKHSPGIYYFKNGEILKRYCRELTVHKECEINGEFYASLPYNFMVSDGLRVWIPCNVKYFCQWGTPEDLHEFLYWIKFMDTKCGI